MAQATRKRLCIIDDDEDLRDLLITYFSEAYDVKALKGGRTTLDGLRKRPPDLLVTEIDLDDLDDFAVLKAVGATPELRGLPVIVLSARSDFASFEKAHRLGAVDFVTKPFRLEDLRERVQAAVRNGNSKGGGRIKLGDLLVRTNLISEQQLADALASQRQAGGRLGEILVRNGVVDEVALAQALAGQMRLDVVDLREVAPQAAALGLLPRDFIVRHRVLPLRVSDAGHLILAMTNPLDVVTIDEVRLRTKRRVVPVICTESAFDEAVTMFFSKRGKLQEQQPEEAAGTYEEAALAHDASIIEIVDTLISDAVSMKASDIHVEPRAEVLAVRCRIDGVLHELREYPLDLQPGILSRIKIMGSMDIAERRLPQDGRTTFETSAGEVVDLRLASIPSLHGENVTLRILEVAPLPPTLASLGMSESSLARYEEAVARPEGGVVICGPTGCGKSTTLYTTLELIKSKETKIYTVEDPIERKLDGIVQTEVKPAIGLSFAQALRSLVRADPDVIMVGEVRDLDTARMAADAAITGHLVFTTLHTADAASSVHRLVEMGLQPYMVAAAFRCVVAQRLVRRLCVHCREAVTVRAKEWEELGLGPAPERQMKIYNPVGCGKCFGTGYYGRLGLYEVLAIDDELREMIATSATAGALRQKARDLGVESLRDDAVRKVLEGATSYKELVRVTL